MKMKVLYSIIVIFSLSVHLHGGENQIIMSAQRAAKAAKVSAPEIKKGITNAFWGPDNSVLAVTFSKEEGTLCLVVFHDKNSQLKVVDVSPVESGNFGKLGFRRSHYQKYTTFPKKWIAREDDLIQISFVTQAWLNGQRYTVSEPLIIQRDGTPLFR